MNPTKYRNSSYAATRVFAAMALAAAFFLVPGAAHAADEAIADTADAVATEESATANAVTTDVATTSSEADVSACAAVRTASVGTTATLDRGHADTSDLISDVSGILTLRIKEDATGSGAMREPKQTLLAVNKSMLTQIPVSVSQVIDAPAVAYPLGQSDDNQAAVLWPSWNALGVTVGGYDAAHSHIPYTGPESGHIHAFISSPIEGTKAVANDGSFDLALEGNDTDQPCTTHKHINWLFTHAGRYTLTVQVSAWAPGNTGAANAVAPARTYTIDVANKVSCLAEPGSAPSTDQIQPVPAPGVGSAVGTPNAPVLAPGAMRVAGTISTTIGVNPVPPSGVCTTSGTTGGKRYVVTRATRETTEAEAAALTSDNAPTNTARTILTVNASDSASGNATGGHSDLGPVIENGTFIAHVKGDRTRPAQWVGPSPLTFTLGDAACITAPADLSFVAIPGSSIWLIPSTQIVGAPWLDLGSQREEIITGTTGPVQLALDTVEGPGRAAVFNAGTLGSSVDEHVSDGPGTGYTLGANTHAHQSWVFTAPGTYTLIITMRITPNGAALAGSGFGSGSDLTTTGVTGPDGRPMISQVVGRAASGKGCDLSLATTGADATPLTVVSLTWAFTGTAHVRVGVIERHRNLRKAL